MIFLFETCCSQQTDSKLNLIVNPIKIDAWLNLMPGGPGSFHISGEIKVKNEEKFLIKNLSLSKLTVIQNEKKIYDIVPVMLPKIESEDQDIRIDDEKDFHFYTKSGLAISKDLKEENSINLILMFTGDNKIYLHQIDNIKIEKVY